MVIVALYSTILDLMDRKDVLDSTQENIAKKLAASCIQNTCDHKQQATVLSFTVKLTVTYNSPELNCNFQPVTLSTLKTLFQ